MEPLSHSLEGHEAEEEAAGTVPGASHEGETSSMPGGGAIPGGAIPGGGGGGIGWPGGGPWTGGGSIGWPGSGGPGSS